MTPSQSPDTKPARERGAGIYVGRPFGVPLHIAPSWALLLAWVTIIFGPVVGNQLPGIGQGRYAVSFAFGLLLGLSILVHELSHSIVALHFGLPVRRMTLQLLGGVSIIDREPETPRREMAISAAGPALSLVLGGGAFLLARALDPHSVAGLLAWEVAFANGLVGVFNLLPGLPLDGGRVLRAAVWAITGRPNVATVVAARVGQALAVVIVLAGLWFSSSSRGGGLTTVVWALLVASFIWSGATMSARSARVQEVLPTVSARVLTRPACSVAADTPLAEALRQAHAAGARGLVVVDSSGVPTGVVSEAAVIATPVERRPWVNVGTVSRRIDADLLISADLGGEALIRALQQAPASEYVVVTQAGEVYGVLAASDVAAAVHA